MSLCEVCRVKSAAWVEARENGRLLCSKECQLAPIGVFNSGAPRDIVIAQLIRLDPVSLARERQTNKRIRDIIDNGEDFFNQWLYHFPRPLTDVEKNGQTQIINRKRVTSPGWAQFIDRMIWPSDRKELARWYLDMETEKRVDFTEEIYFRALSIKAFVPKESHLHSAARRGLINVVRVLLNTPGISKTGALSTAISYDQTEIVRLLLETPGIDPTEMAHRPMITAVQRGRLDIIRLLIARGADPLAGNSETIAEAAYYGHLDVLQFLLTIPGADPTAEHNQTFRLAAERGHLEIVRFLLGIPGVDPAALGNASIAAAVANEHLDVVQLLLNTPGVDPTAHGNQILRIAAGNKYYDMVRLLLKDERIRTGEVMEYLQKEGDPEILRIIQTLSTEEERKRPRFVERRAY